MAETTSYNSRLQPTSIAASSLLSLSFGYGTTSNNGNVLSQTIGHLNNATQYYGYDGVNRISSFTEGSLTRSYGYDHYGNRWVSGNYGLPLSAPTPQAQTSFDAANNRLTGVSYDGSGNQSVMGSQTLEYHAENRQKTLVNGTAWTYFYDGNGRRVKKVSGSTTTVYVYDAMGQLAAEYSTQANPASGRQYLTMDHLGSTRLVTNAAGGVAKRYDYLPFGEGIFAGLGARTTDMHYESSAAPDAFNPKFTGKERDAEAISSASSSGLDYFGARYFSAAQGRFTTPDWSERPEPVPYADLRDPQTLNLYTYGRNNPLSNKDDDGHFWKELGNWLSDGGWTADDEEAQRTRWNRQVRRATDFFNTNIVYNASGDRITARTYSQQLLVAAFQDYAVRSLVQRQTGVDPAHFDQTYLGMAIGALKPVNLPAWKDVGIDMNEVMSGHTSGGQRAVQSARAGAGKDLFPESMSEGQIESAIRQAYRAGQKIKTQGDRVLVRGTANGMTIDMWVNKATKIVETAYPK